MATQRNMNIKLTLLFIFIALSIVVYFEASVFILRLIF